jgi:hypothetical protein
MRRNGGPPGIFAGMYGCTSWLAVIDCCDLFILEPPSNAVK